MQYRITAFAVAFALAGTAGWSQTDPNAAAGISTGTPVTADGEEIGQPYNQGEFGDWVQRCVRTAGEQDPCQLYQLITDQNGGSVAEMTVFPLPEANAPAVAAATVITPLETLLTEQVTLSIDGGQAKRYPFVFCTPQGCVARIGLVQEDLDAFKAGNSARLRIVPAVAPDQEVVVDVSLQGFTAGYEALGDG